MTTDAAVYALAYDALTHPGPASVARFQTSLASFNYCSSFANQTTVSFASTVSKLSNSVTAAIGFYTPLGPLSRSMVEPPLFVSLKSIVDLFDVPVPD